MTSNINMTTNISINKLLLINKIDLPNVLIDIIKDYIFYNKEQAKLRKIKNECIHIIPFITTRANRLDTERWGAFNIVGSSYWISAHNCFRCGEYKSFVYNNVRMKIRCQCEDDN